MRNLVKQAGKLLFLILLGTVYSQRAMAAMPIQSVSQARPTASTSPVVPQKTYSFGEVFDGVGDAWDHLVSSFGKDTKETPKPDDKKEAGQKPPEESKLIQARRLDSGAPIKKEAKEQAKEAKPAAAAPAPYKVYQAPMIMEEAPTTAADLPDPAWGVSARAPAAASLPASQGFSGWDGGNSKTLDTKQPPPLPDHVMRELGRSAPVREQPSSPITEALARLPASEPAAKASSEVPPISALPKQFLPIVPFGAAKGTPAQLLPVASSVDLQADNRTVTRAILFIHDMSRNAAEGVATLMTLMGPERESTLIVAPQFPLNVDVARFASYLPDQGRSVARWQIETGWQWGAQSVAGPGAQGISSFTAMDLLTLFLGDRRRFPNMQDIVIVGHGMGADFVQRYAALGEAPELLEKDRIAVRFVVANPSSFLYFTNQRVAPSQASFGLADEKTCAVVNAYPFGLGNLPPYARREGVSAIRLRFPERRIAYLIGDKIQSDNYMDRSCAAMAQGQDRLSRAHIYERHIAQSFGQAGMATQKFSYVRNAGYDPVSLFGSPCGLSALFGNGRCER